MVTQSKSWCTSSTMIIIITAHNLCLVLRTKNNKWKTWSYLKTLTLCSFCAWIFAKISNLMKYYAFIDMEKSLSRGWVGFKAILCHALSMALYVKIIRKEIKEIKNHKIFLSINSNESKSFQINKQLSLGIDETVMSRVCVCNF